MYGTMAQRGGLVLGMLLSGLGTAQEAARAVALQPRDLDLGTLRVGTHVEANFLVFWNDGAGADVRAEVRPPPFVRVTRQTTADNEVCGAFTRVWIAIATDAAGGVEGAIRVRRGTRQCELPVRAVVIDRSPISTRVLVAETPFDGYSTDDGERFDAWRRVVATGKLEVSYLNGPASGSVLSAELLQRVDVVLLGESCLVDLKEHDIGLLQGFVCGGGRVVIAASRFFRGTVAKANEVLAPFGMQMVDSEPPVGPAFELADEDIVEHPLTAKVGTIVVGRPSPTRIDDPERARPLVRGSADPDQAFVALATTESGGEIVTLGVSLWWNWVNEHPDNARLLRNLLTRGR